MNLTSNNETGFSRQLGLPGLTATGICSMIGASIFIVPFMIQRNVPGIGTYVLAAFLVAAIPAIFASFAYAVLSSAMPRAGGSYIYVSRGLHPYLGFVASFSQWFGLSIVIGVICYMIVPFFRDIAFAAGWMYLADVFERGVFRLCMSLVLLWLFVWINIKGLKFYEKTLIPLMILMFLSGILVIVAGLYFDQNDFKHALTAADPTAVISNKTSDFNIKTFLSAAAVLFASFIGFDSIAQAGSEAKNPEKLLPRAIVLAILIVTCFYILFTFSVYHAIPWQFVADESMKKDISAPGLFSTLLSPFWSMLMVCGAAIALINDLPAMLLSVSRLLFAWAEDGIFTKSIASIHPKTKTPVTALIWSGILASIGIIGSHFASDIFLGIDIMVISMLINFLCMCITMAYIHKINPEIAKNIIIIKPGIMRFIAWIGIMLLLVFLIIHIWKDTYSKANRWYFHSTYVWILVVAFGSILYYIGIRKLKKSKVDINNLFRKLPDE